MTTKTLISGTLLGVSACGLLIGAALAEPDEERKGPPKGAFGQDRDLFARADTNGDGLISQEERTALREQAFEKSDIDGDGFLTEADREAAKAQRAEKMGERRAKAMERRESKRPNLDTDGDGKVSRNEFMAAESERFSAMDTDGDGNISKAEAEAAEAEMRRKFMERRQQGEN